MKQAGVGCRALGLAAVALLVACTAGDGDGLDENGRPIGEGGGDIPLAPTLDSIQANVFTPTCAVSGCHLGAASPEGLNLEEGVSFSLLVDVPSSQTPAILRVEPGDPDNSYLVQKLEGTAAGGRRMPLSGPPFLPQSTVDVIRQWIADGALPGTGIGTTPVVVATNPANGAVLDDVPTEITATFNVDMDPALVSDMTVQLRGSGGDGGFTDGNEVIIDPTGVSLSASNARLLMVDLSDVALDGDDYQLRLVGTGATALASTTGVILDGDADGSPGGDFFTEFTVTTVLPTLASIQANVFTPTCATAGCHTGPRGPGLPAGQDLSSAAASLASLVNVPSTQDPTFLRVAPGDAAASYLILKIEGTQTVGSRMPLGAAPLPTTTIDSIRTWIDNGVID